MILDDVSLPVLVLRMDHYGALGVMRSLGRLGIKVSGIHSTNASPASHSKYCQEVFKWDLDNAPPVESVEYLLQVGKKMGRRPLLVATNDESAIFVSQNAEALNKGFVFPFNPPQIVRSLYIKKAMHFLAKQMGIPAAETLFPKSKQDVIELSTNARFPLLLKASDNIVVARRAGRKMVIVHSKEELLREYDAMEDPDNPSLMLQEYIPGKDDSVWMFNGYFDEQSNLLFGMTGRKIHQTPVYTGMTALGICLQNHTVQEQTEKLVKGVGYQGILDIGYRYDARDKQLQTSGCKSTLEERHSVYSSARTAWMWFVPNICISPGRAVLKARCVKGASGSLRMPTWSPACGITVMEH